MAEPGNFELFDATRHRPPVPARDDADAIITHLGSTRLLKSGRVLWLEASQKAGMVDKARKALVGYDKEKMELALIPAQSTNKQAVLITFSDQQQNATMRLRAAFLHYGIEMLKDSKWALRGEVFNHPEHKWIVRFNLRQALLEVKEKRKKAEETQPEKDKK